VIGLHFRRYKNREVMPDLAALISAIRERLDGEARWLTLAPHLSDNGWDDEADAVRVFWPVFRDNVEAGVPVEETLRQLEQHAAILGLHARRVEGQGDHSAEFSAQ
jgi:hypothetical protein